jgi:nitroreductase
MNTIENIMSRRSIRKFKDTPVTEEQIKTILSAAMNAPSAGDGRPWHYIVVTDRAKLDAFAVKVDDGNAMFKEAQAAILLCSNESKQGFPGYYPQDCACAGQNIYLAAHELGLATTWVAMWGVKPRLEGAKSILNIPNGIEPFALFPLGVPNEVLPAENRYNDELVSWE